MTSNRRGGFPSGVVMISMLAAVIAVIVSSAPVAAIYHPNYSQWHNLYYSYDGAWLGQDLNEVNYYTWHDGTESVSDIYAGLYRSYNDQGLCCINWYNPWLTNRDGSVPLSLRWGRIDCGYGCEWVQDMWSGWVTVQAKSSYGLVQHNTVIGVGRWAPYLVLPWDG